jgi:hypothetical protein
MTKHEKKEALKQLAIQLASEENLNYSALPFHERHRLVHRACAFYRNRYGTPTQSVIDAVLYN